MFDPYQNEDRWREESAENSWTPTRQTDGFKCFLEVSLSVIVLIVFFNFFGNKREAQSDTSSTTEKTTIQATVLPGSAREAVMNGELELADIQHRADAMGWSTGAWQEWYYIASKTGTKMEAIEEAALELNKRLGEESPEFVESLNALGISLEEAKAMKPEELFKQVIYGIQAMND